MEYGMYYLQLFLEFMSIRIRGRRCGILNDLGRFRGMILVLIIFLLVEVS